MNIFVLDKDPVKAAQMHCDKHCVKMVLELYQQLGSAVRRHGATDHQMPLTKAGTPLKGGYHNHPCTLWVGDSRSNYGWATDHAVALCREYTHRYGKQHACQKGIEQLLGMSHLIPQDQPTPFAQAMPEKYKNHNAIKAYRDYYIHDKQFNIQCEWNKDPSRTPHWFKRIDNGCDSVS